MKTRSRNAQTQVSLQSTSEAGKTVAETISRDCSFPELFETPSRREMLLWKIADSRDYELLGNAFEYVN